MPNVRDLLIRMTLNTDNFKQNIAAAKGELRSLKAEYKAISSDQSLENAGEKQVANLRDQKAAAEALVKEYQRGISEIQAKLSAVPQGSQAATQMQSQITSLETAMNNAQAQVNSLQTAINNITLETLEAKAEAAASIFSNLRMGFGELLGGIGDTADSADAVNVRREAARISGTKSFEGATDDQLKALDATVKQLISTDLPLLYEQMYGILEVAGQQGVAIESADKFATVMAKLSTATDMTAGTGSQTMAQFVNLTEQNYEHLDNIGSALVALGNNSATSESQIMEMAHRAATGLHQVGMSSADILGVSAAISSMGIEAQAGGTAVSKLAKQMDEAAKVGAPSIKTLLSAWGDEGITSIYDLYAQLDQLGSGKGWRPMAEALGMNMSDTKALMNAALAAERFSEAMGMSAEAFSSGWNENAANQMLQFFAALGSMGGTDMEDNMLWTMDKLGITEVRMSNMVRALSGNWQAYADSIELANKAYQENIAMDEEASRAFSSNESRRVLNQNKEQNALEAMGQTVTAMRQPWEDFFGDLNQWYADWPGWAQTAVAGAAESMKIADTVLEKMGDISLSVLAITKAVQDLEGTSIGAALISKLGGAAAAMGSAAATLAPYGLLTAGTMYLGAALDESSTEKNWGQFNRDVEQTDQLLAQVSDEHVTRLQGIFAAFTQAMKDFETNDDPMSDRTESIKNAFRQYANDLLREMPELNFWDMIRDSVNLEDGLDQAEIEQIVNSLEFADQWLALGNEAVTSLADGIRAGEAALVSEVASMGVQVGAGLAQGIYDGADQALQAAAWLADEVRSTIQSALDIHSPSGVARILGAYFSEGFALGIEDGVSRVESAADRVAKAVTQSSVRGRGNAERRGSVNVNLNLDGKRLARTIAPMIDEALGGVEWD